MAEPVWLSQCHIPGEEMLPHVGAPSCHGRYDEHGRSDVPTDPMQYPTIFGLERWPTTYPFGNLLPKCNKPVVPPPNHVPGNPRRSSANCRLICHYSVQAKQVICDWWCRAASAPSCKVCAHCLAHFWCCFL